MVPMVSRWSDGRVFNFPEGIEAVVEGGGIGGDLDEPEAQRPRCDALCV